MDSAKAGVIDCSCLLYCDELIEGIEQAMSTDRMEKALDKYKVDIRQRISKSDNRTLMIATSNPNQSYFIFVGSLFGIVIMR